MQNIRIEQYKKVTLLTSLLEEKKGSQKSQNQLVS